MIEKQKDTLVERMSVWFIPRGGQLWLANRM